MTVIKSWLVINAVAVAAILYAMAMSAFGDWLQARFWKVSCRVLPFRRER